MSLVDYAASSDEDEPQIPADEEQNEQVKENLETPRRLGVPGAGPPSSATQNNDTVHAENRTSTSSAPLSIKQTETSSNQSSDLKLPDASFLLSSPVVPYNLHNASDHSSRVAAAMAESAARKRELNGSSNNPRSKIPKGTLPHPKNVPDTVEGRLLPPQLAGRSNVVTEDISKLFVKKPTNSSAG